MITKNMTSMISLLTISFFIYGCASQDRKYVPSVSKVEAKSIFVFMDGTGNNDKVPTNVFRLFDAIAIKKYNDGKTVAIYMPGVGNASDPIVNLAGQFAGFGMEERILKGYKFIIHNYQPGDRIYIFGFSRGAHTARSLAGLVSYAGIPKISDGQDESWLRDNYFTSGYNFGNKILEKTKEQIDIKHFKDWENWKPGKAPIMTGILNEKVDVIRDNNIEIQPSEIEFLGVWDTVPGSQGIDYFDKGNNYLVCKQDKDYTDHKERYKIDSYPTIHHIAHAVSIDEKRDEFSPLFLCSKQIDPESVHNAKFTKLDEVAFAGVHSDVGGGYGHKNNQLPDITLKWMVELLASHYQSPRLQDFIKNNNEVKPDPEGLADLSVSKAVGIFSNYYLTCHDRNKFLPPNIVFHDSVKERKNAGLVPWLYYDKKPKGTYSDLTCKSKVSPADWKDSTDGSKPDNVLCIEQSQISCDALGY